MATHCGAPTRDGSPCQRHVGTPGTHCFQHRAAALTNALTQPRLRLPAQASLPPLRLVVLDDPALEMDIATHTRAPEGEVEGGDVGALTAADEGHGAAADPLEEAVRLLRPLALAGDEGRDENGGSATDPLEEAVRLVRPVDDVDETQAEPPSAPAPRTIPIPPRIAPIAGPTRRSTPVDDGAEPMWLDPGATSAAPPSIAPHEVEEEEAGSALIDPPMPPRKQIDATAEPGHLSEAPVAKPEPDHRAVSSTAPEPQAPPSTNGAPSPTPPADSPTSGLLSRISELTDPPASPQRDKTVAIPRTPPSTPRTSPRPLFRDEFARAAPEPEPIEVPEFLVPGFDESVVPADPATGMPLGTVLSGVLGPELWRRCHVEWSGAHCVALARVAREVDGLAPAAVTSLWAGATAGLRWLGATREQDELAEAVAEAIAHPDGVSKTNSARTIRLYGAAICAAVGRPLRRCACHRDLARDVSEELIELGLAGLADPLPAPGGLATRTPTPNLGRPPRI